ncbi:hypothetical protein KCU62_g158, partial [Aureobasidium sp. EXF-3399]
MASIEDYLTLDDSATWMTRCGVRSEPPFDDCKLEPYVHRPPGELSSLRALCVGPREIRPGGSGKFPDTGSDQPLAVQDAEYGP